MGLNLPWALSTESPSWLERGDVLYPGPALPVGTALSLSLLIHRHRPRSALCPGASELAPPDLCANELYLRCSASGPLKWGLTLGDGKEENNFKNFKKP